MLQASCLLPGSMQKVMGAVPHVPCFAIGAIKAIRAAACESSVLPHVHTGHFADILVTTGVVLRCLSKPQDAA